MDNDKQLELEALAAVGEMLLFDQARGNPEEAQRILLVSDNYLGR